MKNVTYLRSVNLGSKKFMIRSIEFRLLKKSSLLPLIVSKLYVTIGPIYNYADLLLFVIVPIVYSIVYS